MKKYLVLLTVSAFGTAPIPTKSAPLAPILVNTMSIDNSKISDYFKVAIELCADEQWSSCDYAKLSEDKPIYRLSLFGRMICVLFSISDRDSEPYHLTFSCNSSAGMNNTEDIIAAKSLFLRLTQKFDEAGLPYQASR